MKPLDVLLILVSILFATGFIVDQRWGPERRQHRAQVRLQQTRLELMATAVKIFHEQHDRFPTTEEGLDVIPGLREASLRDSFAVLAEPLGDKPGVRDYYGIPYVYENRASAEHGRTLFRRSPANLDRKQRRRWSRKVDQGIFISSIGLQHDAERVFGRAWLDAMLLFFGGVILFLAVAYIIARNQRSGDRVRGINAMILVGVAILLTVVIGLTSGPSAFTRAREPPPPPSGPRSDLALEYVEVLRSFVAAGVYDPAAAAKVEARLSAEFALAAPPDKPADATDDGGSER